MFSGLFVCLFSKEDIRATEKDKVEIYKSFRPGDIVLAKVISLGDAQSNYLLTTAENLEEGSPGSGTYTRHGYIFSSLAGCLMKTSENGAVPVVSVMRETESQLLPDVGAVVTCKVSGS